MAGPRWIKEALGLLAAAYAAVGCTFSFPLSEIPDGGADDAAPDAPDVGADAIDSNELDAPADAAIDQRIEPIDPNPVGFGADVTGGTGRGTRRITTSSGVRAAAAEGNAELIIELDNPDAVPQIAGTLGDNLTIDGTRSPRPLVLVASSAVNVGNNVVLRNLALIGRGNDQLLRICGATGMLLDHVTFFNTQEPSLEIGQASEVSVLNSLFLGEAQGGGVVIDDGCSADVVQPSAITFARNGFVGVQRQTPAIIAGGDVEVVNNLVRGFGDSAISVGGCDSCGYDCSLGSMPAPGLSLDLVGNLLFEGRANPISCGGPPSSLFAARNTLDGELLTPDQGDAPVVNSGDFELTTAQLATLVPTLGDPRSSSVETTFGDQAIAFSAEDARRSLAEALENTSDGR
ncbi:MAG: hypothetical protein AAF938_17845 [Myxococcota bacterium]